MRDLLLARQPPQQQPQALLEAALEPVQAAAEDVQVDPGPAPADAEPEAAGRERVEGRRLLPRATGCRLDSTATDVPTWIRSVAASRCEAMSVAEGLAPYSMKWCSATQAPSRPAASAVRA
ncbi:hypothetical protein GCM10029992_59170 [Glycomyces albus]